MSLPGSIAISTPPIPIGFLSEHYEHIGFSEKEQAPGSIPLFTENPRAYLFPETGLLA
jgi:hypothetical protein